MNATQQISKWHLARIIDGIGTGGWRTGNTVVFRVRRDGDVAVIGHSGGAGGMFARLTMDEAKRRLRTVRSGGRAVLANGQSALWRRWHGFENRRGTISNFPPKQAA